jgi:hypothetical protein
MTDPASDNAVVDEAFEKAMEYVLENPEALGEEEKPGEAPEEKAEKKPGEAPEEKTEKKPSEAPEEKTEKKPGEAPEEKTEKKPGEAPEEKPDNKYRPYPLKAVPGGAVPDVKEKAVVTGGIKYKGVDIVLPENLNLTSEAEKYLQENNAMVYDSYKKEKEKFILKKEIEIDNQSENENRRMAEENAKYVQHYEKMINDDFNDLKDINSEKFKKTEGRMKLLINEYPVILADRGVQHLALRLVRLEENMRKVKEEARAEILKEVEARRAAKLAAATAGASKGYSAPPRRDIESDLDFFRGDATNTNIKKG